MDLEKAYFFETRKVKDTTETGVKKQAIITHEVVAYFQIPVTHGKKEDSLIIPERVVLGICNTSSQATNLLDKIMYALWHYPRNFKELEGIDATKVLKAEAEKARTKPTIPLPIPQAPTAQPAEEENKTVTLEGEENE